MSDEENTYVVESISGEKLTYTLKNGKQYDTLADNVCPLSWTKGKRNHGKTLRNHVKPFYWPHVTDRGYYFCDVEDCPIVYFNNREKKYFGVNELRTPVMHKMPIQTPGRPVCYCMGVLEQQILDELLVKKCCDSLKDIQNYTRANLGKDCIITNPSGRCCGGKIKEILEWAKNKRLEIEPPVLEEAEACCTIISEQSELDY